MRKKTTTVRILVALACFSETSLYRPPIIPLTSNSALLESSAIRISDKEDTYREPPIQHSRNCHRHKYNKKRNRKVSGCKKEHIYEFEVADHIDIGMLNKWIISNTYDKKSRDWAAYLRSMLKLKNQLNRKPDPKLSIICKKMERAYYDSLEAYRNHINNIKDVLRLEPPSKPLRMPSWLIDSNVPHEELEVFDNTFDPKPYYKRRAKKRTQKRHIERRFKMMEREHGLQNQFEDAFETDIVKVTTELFDAEDAFNNAKCVAEARWAITLGKKVQREYASSIHEATQLYSTYKAALERYNEVMQKG